MDEFTLSAALLGAVLGIVNTWHQVNQSRVRLRVFPSMAYPVNTMDDRERLCITVANLSAFPVTISQLGFTMEDSPANLAVITPIIIDGGKFPRRLETHDALTAYLSPDVHLSAGFQRADRAYARTTTGHEAHSSRKAIRRLKRTQDG